MNIHRLASAAEATLNDQTAAVEGAAQRVHELGQALRLLRDDARPLFSALQDAEAQMPRQDLAAPDPEAIRALVTLLREQDLSARARFAELAQALASVLEAERFARLREAIDSYKFSEAANLLDASGVAA
jgi:hypothetical protein